MSSYRTETGGKCFSRRSRTRRAQKEEMVPSFCPSNGTRSGGNAEIVPRISLLSGTKSCNVSCIVPFSRILNGTKLDERVGMVPVVASTVGPHWPNRAARSHSGLYIVSSNGTNTKVCYLLLTI